MGSFIRFIFAAPLAAFVTVIIFLLMYNQLSPRPFLYQVESEPGKIFLSLSDEPVEIWFCDCGWWLPQMPDTSNPWTNSEKPVSEAPKQQPEKPVIKIMPPSAISQRDGDCVQPMDQPVLRLSPPYPDKCRKKKAEGVVRFRFDITDEGYTRNVIILESPDACFNKPIIQWVQKWRYTKRCQSGSIARTGVVETITFRITD